MCKEKFSDADLEIYDTEGKFIGMINKLLVEQQNIDLKTLNLIKMTHQIKDIYFKAMEIATKKSTLVRYAKKFEKLEYLQQSLWGFEPNADWHQWFAVPQCSCPFGKNDNLWGKPGKWINVKCTVHGDRGKEDGVKYVNS